MEINFKGKRALVTGAGKGIGQALVQALHAAGTDVVAISHTQSDLDLLKDECPGIIAVCLDISDWKCMQVEIGKLGDFDLLVNNAGIYCVSTVIATEEEDFDAVMATNVKAVVNISQIVAKRMVARKQGGAIVNLSSILSQKYLHCVYLLY